ncbi:DUF4652 domain-containing protein (plasmid) [Aneurinibacillus sp. Ricciae_BoGa-3]|uniref:DUF4652 domain-containing protein n=1 Tax=Aneurinibacillus sp. Ricciae_BoGa-3 TaxID=3022697 RepID=UPI00233FC576|nr:DUF4652 domain-containing protein [Aneurinibacillus sp. Ricciae_BoGa-3]WCK57196.1 DUF4652 domain-containing protein [Aneurinibacillus sp. Ricciae_BoGa-3]
MIKRKMLTFSTALLASSLFFAGCQSSPPQSKPTASANTQQTQSEILKLANKPTITISSPSQWKTSPNGLYEATVDGKGSTGIEKGFGTIVIKSTKDNHTVALKLDKAFGINTPKVVEWLGDKNLFVIADAPFATISKGGALYQVNINTEKVIPIITKLKKGEEVISVQKQGNNYAYQMFQYNDAGMTKGHNTTKGLIQPYIPKD